MRSRGLTRKSRRSRISTYAHVAEALEVRVLLSTNPAGISTSTDATGVSSVLLRLAQNSSTAQPAATIAENLPSSASSGGSLIIDNSNRVEVKITAKNVSALTAPLAALGFQELAAEPAMHFLEGYLPISAINTINSLSRNGLLGVIPEYRPIMSVGSVTSQGDPVLEADRARGITGNSGAGVTVGVLSDSYNNLGTASAGVASGNLPSNVNVLEDFGGGGTDEGRAMLEIVHDLAPGANLAFATADDSEAGFANNILNLAAPVSDGGAGANVIVDDIAYFDEPFYQDGVVAQAINTVEAGGVSYFVAAGNIDNQAYESSNVNFFSDTISPISPTPGNYFNFNPGVGNTPTDTQTITLSANQGIAFAFEWAQPYYTVNGVTSDLNIYLVNPATNQVVASSTDNNIADQTPFEFLDFTNGGTTTQYNVVISLAAGPAPSRLKYVNYGANEFGNVAYNTFPANGSTIVPHAAAATAMAVAAAPFYNQRTNEGFTSDGPATFLFSPSGTSLGSPQVRAKPDITAIDGVDTSFFGSDVDTDGFPNFFGTSAAAPHAAAVAALIKAVNPSWTPSQIYADMKSTADPNIGGTPGNVNLVGAGLIDAYRAIEGATPVATTLPVNDGFEAGFLGQDWQTYTSGSGRADVFSGNSPSSGTYQLIEDANLQEANPSLVFVIANLSEAILNVNLASAHNVMLNFDEKLFPSTNQLNAAMPATFTGHGNFDGVAFSVDGTNWFRVTSLTGSSATGGYHTFSFNLSTLATADGLTLTADTQIKFQHFDARSFTAPGGGFAFDNIGVTAPLVLTGPAFYLKLDGDGHDLDVWNSVDMSGTEQSYLLSQITSIAVIGTGSNDSLTVDFSAGDPLVPSGLTYTGALGVNLLTVIGDSGNDVVTVTGSSVTVAAAFGSVPINYTNVGVITFTGGSGINSLIQAAQPAGPAGLVFNGMTLSDTLNVMSGTYTFPAPTAVGVVTAEKLGTLIIGNNAKAIVAPPTASANRAVLVLGTLSINGIMGAWTGQLDLTGNDLIVQAGSLATIFNQLQQGFNAGVGYWNGAGGIISSSAASDTTFLTTLGQMQNTNNDPMSPTPIYPQFDNVNSTTGDVLVKYTYYGDADLNGSVNGGDYGQIDHGFGSSLTGWVNGDFNYDNHIDGSDYSLIDNTFNQQGPTLSPDNLIAADQAKIVAAPASKISKQGAAAPTAWAGSAPAGSSSSTSITSGDADELLDLASDRKSRGIVIE